MKRPTQAEVARAIRVLQQAAMTAPRSVHYQYNRCEARVEVFTDNPNLVTCAKCQTRMSKMRKKYGPDWHVFAEKEWRNFMFRLHNSKS